MFEKILISLVPFVLGFFLKTLLDLNLGLLIVKYLSWVDPRNIFRVRPYKIAGEWTQLWNNSRSGNYVSEEGRKSKLKLKQFGQWIYGEFRSNNDEEYYVLGEVVGRNIIGKWGDRRNRLGYFGAFELRIVDANKIEGIWLGHSNVSPEIIGHDIWIWTR